MTDKLCRECDSPVKGRELCEKHLARLRRTGSTSIVRAERPPCKTCGAQVPPSNFGRIYCSAQCKKSANQRAYYEAHSDQIRLKSQAFLASDRGQDLVLQRRYGITLADREALRLRQSGRCVFCDSTGPLFVDHDHESGAVRGLLCRTCNALLGRIGDGDPERINRYLDYLGLEPTRRKESS